MQYLGRKLIILRELPNTAWMSKLIGKTILEEEKRGFRSAMGTRSDINAILAALKSSNVIAVDINSYSVGAGIKGAQLNGVSIRIKFL